MIPANQRANSASGSVIVQIAGDANSVTVHQPHLELTRPRGVARTVSNDPQTGRPSVLDVIRPETRSVDLVGRQAETADLRAWLLSRSPVSVRVLVGNAGIGKTRLAIELIEWALQHDWCAGFLRRHELRRFRSQRNLAAWGWNVPVLAVVDYASATARDLHDWLRELAYSPISDTDDSESYCPLRLLFLDRQANLDSGWWSEAIGRGNEGTVVRQLADPPEPVVLKPIENTGQRRAILQNTLDRLHSSLILPPPGDDSNFDRRLGELTWSGVPLLLIMAAATADRVGFANVLALGSDALAFQIAQTEVDRILKVVNGAGVPSHLSPIVEHITAIVMLRQTIDRQTACDTIEREADALGYQLPGGPAVLCNAFVSALGDDSGQIVATEPPFIREAVLLYLWRDNKLGVLPAILRAYEDDPIAVGETIVRVCQDYAIRGYNQPLSWLRHLYKANSDLEQLIHLSQAMPKHTIELRELSVELHKKLAAIGRSRLDAKEPEHAVMFLAPALNKLSIGLAELGRKREALAVIQDALTMFRRLAATRPDAHLPDVARVLNNMSVHQSDLGQMEDAYDSILEALKIYRSLASVRPGTSSEDIANSLNNLGRHLFEIGKQEEALPVVQEALDLYRDLADIRPQVFRADFARTLINISVILHRLGETEKAVDRLREGLALYRDLAAARPDAFRPEVARSVNNLSVLLSALGQRSEALDATQEAVDIYGVLSAGRPDAFRPDLAMALSNLSGHLSDLGRPEEGLAAIQRSVKIYDELATTTPDAFLPELAGALSNLSNRLSELRRPQKALRAIWRSVGIYRDLAERRPDASRPNLARALDCLSDRLSAVGQPDEAHRVSREALDIYRNLASTVPDAHRPGLAGCLNTLSNRLWELGRPENALEAIRESIDIYRGLASVHPEAFRFKLAGTLNNLSLRLTDLKRCIEALEAIREAISIRRDLSLRQRVVLPDLCASLHILSTCLREMGCYEAALCASREAVKGLQEVLQTDSSAIAPQVKFVLDNYLEICKIANKIPDETFLSDASDAGKHEVEI